MLRSSLIPVLRLDDGIFRNYFRYFCKILVRPNTSRKISRMLLSRSCEQERTLQRSGRKYKLCELTFPFTTSPVPGVNFIKVGALSSCALCLLPTFTLLRASQKLGTERKQFSIGCKPVNEIDPWSKRVSKSRVWVIYQRYV